GKLVAQHVGRRALACAFELGADYEHAALSGGDFDSAALLAEYPAGRAAISGFGRDARLPDEELAITNHTECARIGLGHRAHEVENPPRRPSPIDPAVLGAPAPEVASCGEILGMAGRAAGGNQRMEFADEAGAHRHQLAIERKGGVAVVDRDLA